tara:strand:- start:6767 stop:7105 length:339 start_codon:yes stop_codon:yes gene_type:complete
MRYFLHSASFWLPSSDFGLKSGLARCVLKILPLILLLNAVGISGCKSSRVVFVPEDDGLVRLGPGVRGLVYYWNGSSWELSSNKVLLPEGWYAGSIDGDVEELDSRPAAVDN